MSRRRVAGLLVVAVAGSLGVAACSDAGAYEATPVPSRTASPAPTPNPTPTSSPQPTNPDLVAANCLQSYAPPAQMPAPGQMPAGSTMARIQARGRLIAGVSSDTLLLGARDPLSGKIEGFDIDLIHAISQAIFNNPDKIQWRVITAAQRKTVLATSDPAPNVGVDIMARNVTINCARWKENAFSAEYYRSGQEVLVRRGDKTTSGATITGIQDLVGKRVCAPKATTTMDKLKTFPGLIAVGADTTTGCLVLFQEGKVDAITTDATALAGLAAQDPYAEIVKAPPFTAEPYGLAINKANVDFVRFVNGVLAQRRADGEWTRSYNRWLADALGKAPSPPTPVYGRTP